MSTLEIGVRMKRSAAGAVTLSLVVLGLATPASANPAGTAVVISEVYVNGGSAGASYANKFVEFYNPAASAFSLAGTTLQYRAATSTVTPGGAQVFALSGAVPAHGYFLVQLPGNGAANPGAALPTPDLTTGTSVNPGAAGGTLFLAASASGVLPTDAAVIDKVGWGTSNSPEGTAPTGNSVVLSYQRATTGADTDDNAADFTTAAPTPEASGGDTTEPEPEPAETHTIAEIQGSTDISPYVDKTVTTHGVVTAAYPSGGFNGFFVETGGADLTPGASDGLFVFGSPSAAQVKAGDSVEVTGKVAEYQGETELTAPTVTKLSTALEPVVPRALPWTELSTDAQKEAHEGELVAPQGTFTVSDNYDTNFYGSFTLAAGDKPLRQPTDAGRPGSARAQAVTADNAARMITLDDGSSANYSSAANSGTPLPWLTPDTAVTVGAKVSFHQPVVLEYRFSLWNFQPTAQVTGDGAAVATFSDLRTGNQQPSAVGGGARLATFNVENYFPMTGERYVAAGLGTCTYYTDRAGNPIAVNTCTGSGPRGAATAESFARQQAKIVTGVNRLGASIVSLEEIENSVKFGEPRDTALAGLVDALNAAAGSDVWAYVPSPAADQLPPLTQQDVIRTAFIYKKAQVTTVGASTVLTGLSDPGEPFSIARQPLAQGFKKAGASDADVFLVVANHWKSKGAGTPLYPGDVQDTSSPAVDQGAYNETRVREAEATVTFAAQRADTLRTDRIFLLGDFNAYTQEDPIQKLYDAGYADLGSVFDPAEQTYSYNGLAGSLDHILASPAARRIVTGADVWQINAQEAIAYAYSRYNYNATQFFDATDPFAASDHDPVLAGLTLPATPAFDPKKVYGTGDLVSYQGAIWRALWWTAIFTPGEPYGAWEEIAVTSDGTALWTPSRVFVAGDIAVYQGKKYVAQWWTRNQPPGQPWGPWKLAA